MAADDVSISDRLSKPAFSIVCFIIMSVTHSLITAVVMVEAGRAKRYCGYGHSVCYIVPITRMICRDDRLIINDSKICFSS